MIRAVLGYYAGLAAMIGACALVVMLAAPDPTWRWRRRLVLSVVIGLGWPLFLPVALYSLMQEAWPDAPRS